MALTGPGGDGPGPPGRPTTDIVDGAVTWRFDDAFLTSNWTCIWGRGCLGILDEPAPELGQGCCSVGARSHQCHVTNRTTETDTPTATTQARSTAVGSRRP